MSATGNTLFMGRSLHNRFLHLSLTADNHMMTIAGARSGKGATASIPNLLTWPHSAVVVDIKGTHTIVTARYRREVLKQDVYIVDPFQVVVENSDGFNPLAVVEMDAPDVREQISTIGDALVVPTPNTRDPHWDEGAQTILNGSVDQLLTDPNLNKGTLPTLPMLRDLLQQPTQDDQDRLWATMAANKSASGLARDAGNRVTRGTGTNEILGLLSNADKHSEWLSGNVMKSVLSKTTFRLAQIKEKPTTIYLVLPPHYLEKHKRFLRLFINLTINQMSRGGRSRVPVLMLMDEFLACGHMSEVVKAFGLMAGYNLVLWPFIQDLGKLKDIYHNSVNSFINNSRAVQVFGVSDEETTQFVSTNLNTRSLEYVWGKNSIQAVPLRTPAEVAKEVSAESDCQYILRAGRNPLFIEKVRYYEDKKHWKNDAKLPAWLMQRLYPFWTKYDQDPDFRQAG